jgi:hypothetical protein
MAKSALRSIGMDEITHHMRLEAFDWTVRTLNVFRSYNIYTVEDLLSLSDDSLMGLQNFGRKCLREVHEFKAEFLTGISKSSNKEEITHDTSLESLDWSVRTLNVFRTNQILTVADLLTLTDFELLGLANFGQLCLREVNLKKTTWDLETQYSVSTATIFPDQIRELGISILHLGPKKEALIRKAGIRTLGEVLDAGDIRRIRSIGSGTRKIILQKISAIKTSTDQDGKLDLDLYCSNSDIPLIPSTREPLSGQEFLEGLTDIFDEISEVLPDAVDIAILRSRLTKGPGEKKTLEAIAISSADNLSRERVRQKEKKLLKQIAGGLLWDEYLGLELHFRPSFSKWWKSAAHFFTDREEVDFDAFLSGLCEQWNVDSALVMDHLPIILAIVTGDGQMPSGFRSAARLDPKLYGDLPDETKNLKLSKLRIGKYSAQLDDVGISTLGDLIEACRIGLVSEIGGTTTRKALEHLSLVADCMNEKGAICWALYRGKLGLNCLPELPPNSASGFLDSLEDTIIALLRKSELTLRAPEIFEIRTARHLKMRQTLAQAGKSLNAHWVSIKREETTFLQRLNNLIVTREFSSSSVWLDEGWLEYWIDASLTYNENKQNPELFVIDLATLWDLPNEEIDRAAPVLWAILNGYPKGRLGIRTRQNEITISSDTPKIGRIKLRGFRRVN